MAKQCWRCGHIAAADGHTTYGETQDCVEAFAFAQQLARWTTEWPEDPPSTQSRRLGSGREAQSLLDCCNVDWNGSSINHGH